MECYSSDTLYLDGAKYKRESFFQKVIHNGVQSFRGCEKLTSIGTAEGNNHFKVLDGEVFDKEITSIIYAATRQK